VCFAYVINGLRLFPLSSSAKKTNNFATLMDGKWNRKVKKIILGMVIATSMISSAAMAESSTLSLGYAQSDVEGFKDIRGVNLQYRYELDSPLSVLGSFTYMSGDDDQDYYVASDAVHNSIDVKYYSLMVGPAYRINEYVSLYALGGVAHTKADVDTTWVNAGDYYVGRGAQACSLTRPSSWRLMSAMKALT